MRLRHSTVLTSTCLALWALTSWSAPPSATASAAPRAEASIPTASDHEVLPSERLADRLLTADDLGPGIAARPAASAASPEASVVGCPQLEQLGSAAGNPYAVFPNQGKRVFSGPGGTQLAEELYSAPPKDLAVGVGRIMTAMGACPSYQLVTATTVAEVRTQTVPVPRLGDKQWGPALTVTADGRRTVVQQNVIRDGPCCWSSPAARRKSRSTGRPPWPRHRPAEPATHLTEDLAADGSLPAAHWHQPGDQPPGGTTGHGR
ncbi:hypothetical protein ACFY7Y_32455 [Streptomyces virginiae]|uniref:hypothetical protein n=1 Tax=Streptomyces TaxID=1883 RepID=UPI000A836240|nr:MULTISPECIES: hypothetical protein [Streptomyces]MCX4807056.1 hypothetical protein [Streptomyces sp. NBC_01214]MCX5274991.1 hypothetical protein [Streptomyces virginiae]MCX5308941.1 hypothetical protein [Streptomyces sp. NBC_00160]WSQ01943.1 hypothetical protein OG444_32360 [Streptomyces sp. NBC_01232]